MELYSHQRDAVDRLKNGSVLWGGVGSGKSLAAMTYYVERELPKDIYVITTAKKRDSLDWEREGAQYGIGKTRDATIGGVLVVDSWNNISKYEGVTDAFFVFDEQRLVGTGSWTRSFLKISRRNRWILLSATPGDTWLDYAAIFVANGFYPNHSAFKREHVVYSPYTKYPKIERYLNVGKLLRLRDEILVEMPYLKTSSHVDHEIRVQYDVEAFRTVLKDRWNIQEQRPISNVSELFSAMRKVVNSDPSRLEAVRDILKRHDRLIVFYNFDYELHILRTLGDSIAVAEWNGHKHEPLPDSDRWLYLVQYASGSEGWNCIETNTTLFYSLTYSYKQFKQAKGRIDRLNSPYSQMHYYVLLSNAPIDSAIKRCLSSKRNFNESKISLEALERKKLH
jgi:hypothetical protein